MQWHRIFHRLLPWPYLLGMRSTSCKECTPLQSLHSAVASCWVMRAAVGQGEGASIKTSLGVILVPFFSTPGGSLGASWHMSENLICERQQRRKDGVWVSSAGNTEKGEKQTIICVTVRWFSWSSIYCKEITIKMTTREKKIKTSDGMDPLLLQVGAWGWVVGFKSQLACAKFRHS